MLRLSLLTCFVGSCLVLFAKNENNIQHTERINGTLYINDRGHLYKIEKKVLTVKLLDPSSNIEAKLLKKNRLGYCDIEVPDSIDVELFSEILKRSGKFESIEYNSIGKLCFTPNDGYYNWQNYLRRINVPSTWDFTTGSPTVKVAIIDSGINADHPDIGFGADNYTNINQQMGWDYFNNTSYSMPKHHHGTAVAGIIGAKTNNSIGISGITGGNNSSGVTMISYCVTDSDVVYGSFVDDAILDAVDKGAKIINISMGVAETSALNAAIQEAYNNNVNIICATGNDTLSSLPYPACHEKTIAVGAISIDNHRRYSSNYGIGLDIVAPGDLIYCTNMNNYTYTGGTSFSAPQVSGVVALMLSVNPYLSPLQIKNIINNTAEKLSAYTYDNNGWNQEVGYGVLDAYKAVLNVIKINGSDKIYNSDVYSLNTSNLPNIYSVSWTLSGDNASCFTVQNDTPATGKCTITRKNNVEFSGSISLTLTAQISYNGTVVRTLTKPVTAFYISGDPNPCSTEIYSVEDLPNNCTVTWDLSGLGYSVLSDVIPEGAQNNNYFGVQRTSQNSYASATVTATLWSGNDEVGVLEKRIWSGAGFTGTWYPSSSQSAPYLPEYTASELQCEIYTVDPNKTIVMQSDDFIGTLLTCNTDNGNVFVSHSINSSTASFYTNTANGHSFTVIGKKLGTCKVFRFKFLAVGAPEPDEPLMLGISATGHDYVFSLTEKQENTEEQQAARTIRNWKLTILHSETGQAIYEGLAESDAITVNTSGWKPGIYVAVANVNGKNIAQKLSVTR